ncbi:MAG: riboflavin synthase [Saprospiraceae bacterium]
MFTGIIESKGIVTKISGSHTNLEFYIHSDFTNELKIDQSIAHNGVCLTIDSIGEDWYRCTLIEETLNVSNFRSIQVGDALNLERSILANSRMDGHFVQGHVDCVSKCIAVKDLDGSWEYSFEIPEKYKQLIVYKGSICINGVSLTISALEDSTFSVSIIPYTYHHTNFNALQNGHNVNIEFDILGKYIQRIIAFRD